ncbi:MAG: AIPR family protein [Clostridiales bacterium]|nr:AIPR family protein [Clostridiales bacterium]
MPEDYSVTMTFPVKSFKKIPNPYLNLKKEQGDQGAHMYVAICDVKLIPDNIPMGTNPREQNLNTNVAKKIKTSLLDPCSLNFYLLNRGILLSAKDVSFNTYSNELTLTFGDLDVHGNVDGGHTYRTILKYRNQLDLGQQFVKIEILTGIEDIFQNLAAARNTSVQVQDKSIAELENRFGIIKTSLASQDFMQRVFFKENDEGDIDVADILCVLMLFNIDRFPNMENFPIISYSGKKRCIDLYIQDHKKFGETGDNPYVKMKPLMPDFFELYDTIEQNMSVYYKRKNPNGRYGATKGVVVPKEGASVKSKYKGSTMDVQSPNGFIYPILGAFRALVKEENGFYTWKVNPFSMLEKVGPDLVESTVSMSRSLGNNPQSAGKNVNLWKTLYMTVAFSAMY